MRLALALAALVAAAGPAVAADRCMARFVQDTGAQDAPDMVQHRGEMYGPITQLNVTRKTGQVFYCAHGAGCYPASAIDIISRCRFVPSGYDDPESFLLEAR